MRFYLSLVKYIGFGIPSQESYIRLLRAIHRRFGPLYFPPTANFSHPAPGIRQSGFGILSPEPCSKHLRAIRILFGQ